MAVLLPDDATRDARAITDAWNADRKTRGLGPLSLIEALREILSATRGLVCGDEQGKADS